MHIISLNIKNFKSFQNVLIHFNPDLNILTGVNNAGKTTILEAISLWNECFTKLIREAKRSVSNYKTGDWTLGNTQDKYFRFDEINSVRSPNAEDIFYNRNKKNKIEIAATITNGTDNLEIRFKISDSGGNYIIELENFTSYNFTKFNAFFRNLPEPLGLFYSSPVPYIPQQENFVTDPQIKDAIKTRNSVAVLRNRIYRLYQTPRFQAFQSDLSFILYNTSSSYLKIVNRSDIQRNPSVQIDFTIGNKDVEKDIALLGSGSLQAIEILLNIYQQGDERRDLNIILLDEPDSHIHRDIQKRLMIVLTKFSKDNQIFFSTHNESLIRSASHKHLFHLDGQSIAEIKSIDKGVLNKIGIPHFSGIYPSQINPLIRSLGSTSGLDFINAIEADKLIFVEGEDDAKVYAQLLQQIIGNDSRKFMFWVLGGISKVFENIQSYKKVFSEIKNGKTLWEKSYLIFDKDDLTDDHKDLFVLKLKEKLGLGAFCFSAYTQESVLFTDLLILTKLLSQWINNKTEQLPNEKELLENIEKAYNNIENVLKAKYTDNFVESNDCYKQYRGKFIDKTKVAFNSKFPIISLEDVELVRSLKTYYNQVIQSGNYYKLMTKEHVEIVINESLTPYNILFSVEEDYFDLISFADKSLWFREWDFLSEI